MSSIRRYGITRSSLTWTWHEPPCAGISGWPVFAQSGAICTYGPRLVGSHRRLAYYEDRVLKGTRPEQFPIEQPTEFELVVNVKTAKALRLTIPPTLLARANEVIE